MEFHQIGKPGTNCFLRNLTTSVSPLAKETDVSIFLVQPAHAICVHGHQQTTNMAPSISYGETQEGGFDIMCSDCTRISYL